jgi:hypothetical protein
VREAETLVAPTDELTLQADLAVTLSQVLDLAGRPGEARVELERALDLFEQKGDLVDAARARERLARPGS